jgi:hypothetical protein
MDVVGLLVIAICFRFIRLPLRFLPEALRLSFLADFAFASRTKSSMRFQHTAHDFLELAEFRC